MSAIHLQCTLQHTATHCNTLQHTKSTEYAVYIPTGWQRCTECLISWSFISTKEPLITGLFCGKMTYKDQASYASWPPCNVSCMSCLFCRSLMRNMTYKDRSFYILSPRCTVRCMFRLFCRSFLMYGSPLGGSRSLLQVSFDGYTCRRRCATHTQSRTHTHTHTHKHTHTQAYSQIHRLIHRCAKAYTDTRTHSHIHRRIDAETHT